MNMDMRCVFVCMTRRGGADAPGRRMQMLTHGSAWTATCAAPTAVG
jgi:hypothetical protein